ncbi:MAG: helix-turn-helix transcriptional regulator, partial [Roseicyclus sp.]
RLLAAMPPSQARRTEADAEALLEAQGFASRPGPRVVVDMTLLGTLTEALRAPWELRIAYRGARDSRPQVRLLEPHGLLLGTRRYLIARPVDGDGVMRRFRLDRIEEAAITSRSFRRDPEFDLAAHAARAFGSYHSEEEYGPVVWRFAPEAAETARRFLFHPDQEITGEPDGAITVRFLASGHLEMAWHLYQWGDKVEVLAPDTLREMVGAHRRDDFPALP